MARLTLSLAIVAFSVVFTKAEGTDNSLLALDGAIDAAFNRLLKVADDDFSFPGGRLQDCGPSGEYKLGSCRRYLKNEPEEARELLPFLLKDEEAMKMWRIHFHRHVKDAIGDLEQYKGVDKLLHAPGLTAVAENEFWSSRPAASKGALAHLNQKMETLKLQAAAQGTDPNIAVTWEAEVSLRFKYNSIKDATQLMGTYLVNQENPDKPPAPVSDPLPSKVFPDFKPVELKNFDARDAFEKCKDVIGHVRDQGNCGACWAFSSTESLNDRFCIKSGGKNHELLSPQHTTSCCDFVHCLSFGCHGGQPHMAWRWFTNSGVVTGGDYDELHKGKSCWPYEMSFCNHHVEGPFPNCDGNIANTPKCRKTCEEEEYTKRVRPFRDDLHFAVEAYSVSGREHIKRELVDNGTLSGAFMVYEDFLLYKTGIYHHVTGRQMGGHAIKVIGFGTQEGKDYWLAVNSWNEYWGEKGTFKIQMGDSGIDDEMIGGLPKLKSTFRQQASQDL